MSTSKVVYNGETLIDISEDTVTPETLAEGATAHDSNGEPITGTMKPGSSLNVQADLAQTDPTKPDYVKGQEVIDDKIETKAVTKSEKGAVNGVATLDENGKIPLNQLPEGISTGGSTNNADFKVTNNTGWLSKTVAYGSECKVYLDWSSVEDGIPTGNGIVKISIGDTVKSIYEEEQGEIEVDIDNYLIAGKNSIGVEIVDIYGNNRKIVFSVNCVKIGISSYFDGNVAYTGVIPYSYVPTGAIEKTIHFLIDGEEIDTQIVTASGREQEFNIPAQSHGHHIFEVYFTGTIDKQPVKSDSLIYDLICYEEGNTTPIIACVFNTKSVKQFATVNLSYIVYTPQLLSSEVTITDNFGYSTTRTVDRTLQPFSYKAENVGSTKIMFKVGEETERVISFDVIENKINVHAETSNLELYMTSKGRSNNDVNKNPLEWSYGDIEAELTGFNLTNDCWQLDNNGDTVLRVTGDARVNIPFNIFGDDFRTNGKTIEFEFATRDVLNYDAEIISCWSGDRGIQITAQKALLKSEKSEIFTQYKEDEHIRIAFSIEKRSKYRLLSIYLNGVLSGVKQYSDTDDFSQASPVGISIGSNECTTDIYCIRVYGNDLSRYQILDNWIADTQNLETLIERYDRNNIYDEYGEVTIETLPSNLPYLVLECDKIPETADDEFVCGGYYVDPLQPKKSFTFNGATVERQGTSSMDYKVPNLKIKYKNGFIIDGIQSDVYRMRDDSVGTSTFTYKADVASIEGANNLQLARLYDDICPVKTPPQEENDGVRQGIDGLPMVIFHDNGTVVKYIGKYNFNNDKGTPEVFGFQDGDECWSVEVNVSDRVLYKSDDFSDDSWKDDFESRFPKNYYGKDRLQALVSWVKSTDREQAKGDALTEPVTYGETTYTNDTVEYRFAKFRNEAPTIFEIKSLQFFYLFTSFNLMIDNWAKNTFPTYFAKVGKWFMLPYDFDTALGINNEGQLVFGYNLEDTDILDGGSFVFNGQNSVLMNNVRDCFFEEIKQMYKDLRSKGLLTFEDMKNRFNSHQNVWGEAIFNEDMYLKHLSALYEDGSAEYLPMALGDKELQREFWLYNRFYYKDSYYVAGDSLKDKITFRSWGMGDIVMTPYTDIYTTVEWASAQLTQDRTARGTTATHKCPLQIPVLNDTEINIYSASKLNDLGDLSPLKIGGFNDFSCATKIKNLKLGAGGDYRNGNLTSLSLGNNTLLQTLDVRNCYNLAESVDLRGCTNLEYVYFEGTATKGVDLPDGGILKTLHLPSTVTSLDIRNQPLLADFEMPSYENLTTLRLENLNVDLFDTLSMILQMPENSRVRVLGVEWNIDTPEEIFEVFDKLDSYRGLDEYGNNVDKPQISGVIHTGTITSEQLKEMKLRQPNFTIDYEHISSVVNFYNYDGELLHTETVWDNGDCPDPIPEIGTPLRPETDESKFIYSGWSTSLENITENTDITALYDEYKKYYISFIDDFGNAVKVNGNDSNIYYDIEGENIVALPDNLPNYSIVDSQGATWDYHFEGWSLNGKDVIEIPAVSGTDYNITYQAVFSEHRVYVVKFMNDTEVHNELHLYEGERISVPETTPARVSTYQFDYEFAGWTLDGENIVDVAETIGTEDITYIAKYTPIDRYYLITFLDWNGDELAVYSVKHDEKPIYDREMPTKVDSAQWHYDFDGWSPEIIPVTGEAVYTATYLETLREYTVTWYNHDGTVLETDYNVPYGTIASYDGESPTKQGDAQWSYVWVGWGVDVFVVTGKMEFTARYEAEVNKYKVTWKNYDGAVLETDEKVPYGQMPDYNGATPTRQGNAEYSYEFLDWDTNVTDDVISGTSAVEGNIVYTAVFLEKKNKYTISFVDHDGTPLKSEVLEYGSAIVKPANPTRTGYTFTGWSPAVATTVTGNADYTAQYSINSYTLKFVGYTDFAGTVKEEIVHTVVYGASLPQPSEITREGYDFAGWDKQIPSTMPAEDVIITAQYKIKTFTIRFVNEGGTELYSNKFAYGSTPTYSGVTPTKASTDQYDYVFAGWGTIVSVTGEATYTAQYTQTVKSYTITWKNYDGSTIKIDRVEYGKTPTYNGETPTRIGYSFAGWGSVVPVIGDATYTAQYTLTIYRIEARPTLYTASSDVYNISSFISDSGAFYAKNSNTFFASLFYGFDFEKIRELSNQVPVEIKSIKLSSNYKQYGSYSNRVGVKINFVGEFDDKYDYTDLGDGTITVFEGITASRDEYTPYEVDLANSAPIAFSWINSNLTAFLNGKTSKTFGVRWYGKYHYVNEFKLIVEYCAKA